MAAPTPVRALVHSSTLVTAGIYLIIRFFPIIVSRNLPSYLFILGTLTIIIASLSACRETDIKKVIALSTLRQLGLITSILALGFKSIALFHLVAHATFKALLFIAGGKIIHENSSRQDTRSLGSTYKSLPFTRRSLNSANLALCGLPFLTGFYSKDLIIESITSQNHSLTILSLFFLRIGLSSTYSIRLTHFRLLNRNNRNPLTRSSEN